MEEGPAKPTCLLCGSTNVQIVSIVANKKAPPGSRSPVHPHLPP